MRPKSLKIIKSRYLRDFFQIFPVEIAMRPIAIDSKWTRRGYDLIPALGNSGSNFLSGMSLK